MPERDVERWHALLAGPSVTMLVAEEDDELLGLAACGESRDPDAGARTGEVRTFVAAGRWRRGAGRAFYEAHGFTRDGAERTEAAWAHVLEVRHRLALA